MPFFLAAFALGVVDRRTFDEEFEDPQTRRLWHWHLWLCPPAVLLAAAVFLL